MGWVCGGGVGWGVWWRGGMRVCGGGVGWGCGGGVWCSRDLMLGAVCCVTNTVGYSAEVRSTSARKKRTRLGVWHTLQ